MKKRTKIILSIIVAVLLLILIIKPFIYISVPFAVYTLVKGDVDSSVTKIIKCYSSGGLWHPHGSLENNGTSVNWCIYNYKDGDEQCIENNDCEGRCWVPCYPSKNEDGFVVGLCEENSRGPGGGSSLGILEKPLKFDDTSFEDRTSCYMN